MPSVADIRAKYPSMAGLDDDQVVDALQHAFYPGVDRSVIASKLGVAPPAPPPPPPAPAATIGDRIGDAMISAEKGAIAVPETAVGLADLVTGGHVGKFLQNEGGAIGFRPAEAKAFLDSGYSPAQKAAMQKVGDARGFLDTAKAVVENPSTAVQSAIESAPSMLAGGVVSRGAMAVLPRLGGIVSGALGEGVVQAGQAAESIRQETPDGLLTPAQSALAVASGAGDTALALLGGKVAHRLGLHDAQTMLAVGHGDAEARQGIVKSLLGGALSEGVLEELPQSIQEQVAQNAALGKPLDEGVDQAAVMGLFTGAAMGGGANALGAAGKISAPVPAPVVVAPSMTPEQVDAAREKLRIMAGGAVAPSMTPEQVDAAREKLRIMAGGAVAPPVTGPTSRAAATAVATGAAQTAGAPEHPVPDLAHPHDEAAASILSAAQQRAEALKTAERGTPEEVDEDGVITQPEVLPRTLTPDEKLEQQMLDEHGGDATALAHAYGVKPETHPAAFNPVDVAQAAGSELPTIPKTVGGVTLPGATSAPAPTFAIPKPPAAQLAPGEVPTVAAPDGSQRAVFPDLATAQASLKAARARDGVKGTPVAPHPLPDGRFVLAMPGEFGRPYPSRTAATAAAARAPGAQAVKVDGGWMVQPAPSVDAQEALDQRAAAAVGQQKVVKLKDGSEVRLVVQALPGKGQTVIRALTSDGEEIGSASPVFDARDGQSFADVKVNEAFRRKGVASAMYDFAEEYGGRKLSQSGVASDDAKAFWKNRRRPVPTSKAPNAQAQPAAPVAPAPAPAGAVRTERPAGARTAPVEAARLPAALTGAKPRYAFGSKQFTLKFASDVDRAAYIAAQAKPSEQDAKFVEWATAATGMSEKEVRAHGAQVRAAIKEQARAAEKGGVELSVPDQLGEAPEFRARIDTPASGTVALDDAWKVIHIMRKGWVGAPKIYAVQSAADIPGYNGTQSTSRGLINLSSGDVYVVVDKATSVDDIANTLVHEVLGHFGLRAAFGGKLVPILDQLAVARADLVAAKAKQYGLDMKDLAQRREAADEVLAELAETQPTQGWVKRAVAAVRNWLRAAGLKLDLSDNDIAGWLASARRAVERNAPDQNLRSLDAGVKAERRSNDTRLQMSDMLRPATEAARGVNLFAGYKIADYLRADGTPGKLSLWHKTVGTMFHLAETHPAFKPVFNAVQSFIRDTSFYANEAADLAPRIIPKLEGLRDLKKQPLSVADTRALGPAVFGGIRDWTRDAAGNAVEVTDAQRKAWNDYETNRARAESENAARAQQYGKWDVAQKRAYLLAHNHITPETMRMWDGQQIDAYERLVNGAFNNRVVNASKAPDEPLDSKPGILFTDEELRRLFNLNDQQVSLYHETRATVDHSLDEMGVTAMIRAAGQTMNADLKARVLAELSDSQKTRLAAPAAQVKTADAIAKMIGAEVTDDGVKQTMQVIADQIEKLKAEGYMPASRFGTYTLDVKEGDERVMFRLFESAAERARFVRQLQESGVFQGAQFVQGTTSQSEYQLFNTISPDSLQLFADLLERANTGVNAQDEVFQQYLREARAQNSAMKRLIHRKGIAGYSEDVGRVLAGFVYSNGRVASYNLHNESIGQAIQAIPQGQGELKDAAVRLATYVQQPQEEAAGLRGLLFAQLLGGSVASAIVNATQPFATTLPYLSQFGGLRAAGAAMSTAAKLAAKMAGGGTTGDAALDAALKRAAEEGTTAPQEVHQLQGQASGRSSLRAGDGTKAGNAAAKAANAWTRTTLAWGKVFGVAEQFNRRLTFIAAFNLAREQKMPDPAAFAKKAVDATQFVNNKGNKPQWARGAIGATLFTFKQYTVSYLEMLSRMAGNGPEGRKALLYAIAALTLMAGADGLPFVENIDDVIDAVMQRLGYNFSTKTARHKAIQGILGDDIGKFFEKGMTGLPGVPIDVSGRLGMARPLPGTGLLVDKADYSNDMMELVGPVGDIVKRGFQSAGQLAQGNVLDAVNTASPKAVQNAVKGVQMAQSGEYDDASGKKVIDTDMRDALAKFIGFQPKAVSEVQGASFEVQKAVAENRLKQTQLADALAQALHKGDTDAADKVRAQVDDWNAKNPDTPIRIKASDLRTRLRSMNLTKTERIEKAAPKAMRAEVAARLAETP